jgi:hypothetical protein
VVIGCINNDTRLDIAVAYYSVGVFLGKGDGTFRAQKITSTGTDSGPVSLVIGDFNRDNRQDIAVAAKDMDVAVVFLGRGTGIFRAAIMYSASTAPRNIDCADFNGDHILDLAVLNQGDSSRTR